MELHRIFKVGLGASVIASSLTTLTLAGPFGVAPAAASGAACAASNITGGPIKITFWEEMSAENESAMKQLVYDFNKSQSKVQVTDVNIAGGYNQAWDNYLSDLSSNPSALPNVAMMDQYVTQGAVDSKSFIPVSTCVAGTHYSTTKFAPKVIREETVGGKLQAMPYSVSAPVLIYNQNSFAAAKITSPPTNLVQMAADAKAMKGTSYTCTTGKCKGTTYKNTDGMTIKIDPWYLQIFQGVGGHYFVNNQNGRSARATAASFNDSIGLTTFTDLQNIVKAGDAVTNPSSGSQTTAYANLYAIGFGKSGMTIDTSATLGTILSALGAFPNVKLGVAPLPTLGTGAGGGVAPGGNALFLPSLPNKSAAKLAASWEFIQYLVSAVNMAKWDGGVGIQGPYCTKTPLTPIGCPGTGYVPIRTDAATSTAMVKFWKTYPELKVAYTEIAKGTSNNATAGPLLGDYYTVYNDLVTFENQLLGSPYPSPSSVLSAASSKVTSDIVSYNSSL